MPEVEGAMSERRVNSKMLLVGSLPAESAEHAFRAGAELFGDMVFSLPDGETGPMAGWVSFERERLIRPSRDVVVLSETESPTGLPRHAYETPVFTVRDGVEKIDLGSWPRIDVAIESYGLFQRTARRWGDPGRAALSDRASVPIERNERLQG